MQLLQIRANLVFSCCLFVFLLSFSFCKNNPAHIQSDPGTVPDVFLPYKAGDTLTVVAKSGLVLREKPSPAGTKIKTINALERVVILPENIGKIQYDLTLPKEFQVRGFWAKVRTSDGKEGYAFDGFMSKGISYYPEQLLRHSHPLYDSRFAIRRNRYI